MSKVKKNNSSKVKKTGRFARGFENSTATINVLVWLASLSVSSVSLFLDGVRFGFHPLIAILLPVIVDINLVRLFMIIVSRLRDGKSVAFHIGYAAVTMVVTSVLVLDYWLHIITNDVIGKSIILGYVLISVFIMGLTEAFQLVDKAKKSEIPPKEQAYNYWLENEVQGGKKIKAQTYKDLFGPAVPTVNEWRRKWWNEYGAKKDENSSNEEMPSVPSQTANSEEKVSA